MGPADLEHDHLRRAEHPFRAYTQYNTDSDDDDDEDGDVQIK